MSEAQKNLSPTEARMRIASMPLPSPAPRRALGLPGSPQAVHAAILRERLERRAKRPPQLSPRWRAARRLRLAGMPVRQIAAQMGVSTSLVHRKIGTGAHRPFPGCRLTGREREVLALTAAGCTCREMAAALGITERTAEAHRADIRTKLGVSSIAELVIYAARQGIIEI